MKNVCERCGAQMSWDEIGLHRKLVNRGAVSFLCHACLGERFGLSIDELYAMIERFRRQGCALFTRIGE